MPVFLAKGVVDVHVAIEVTDKTSDLAVETAKTMLSWAAADLERQGFSSTGCRLVKWADGELVKRVETT